MIVRLWTTSLGNAAALLVGAAGLALIVVGRKLWPVVDDNLADLGDYAGLGHGGPSDPTDLSVPSFQRVSHIDFGGDA